MKIVKTTGLVPVKVLDETKFDNRVAGEVFGARPKVAKVWIDLGIVSLVDIPKEVETADSDTVDGADDAGLTPGPVEPMKSAPKKKREPKPAKAEPSAAGETKEVETDEGAGEGAGSGAGDGGDAGAGQ